ncbi:hypothetical protein BS78_03G341400 [Paspalum vaginatum]|nr:hypothetical protein BS78_03G341400 [Paspalum vaginatum]
MRFGSSAAVPPARDVFSHAAVFYGRTRQSPSLAGRQAHTTHKPSAQGSRDTPPVLSFPKHFYSYTYVDGIECVETNILYSSSLVGEFYIRMALSISFWMT